ncbi:ArnT family glycosyltransferase [Frateuria aurantia]
MSSLPVRRGWLLWLYALIVIGAGIGLRDPWPSDEPRYTLAAQEMVSSGDWLFPHRGTELYADKPPMLMWTEAASYVLTGHWRIAFLLPSLLSALACLWLVYDLGRRLWNPRTGLYAAAAVLMCFQLMFQVKRAQIDPLLMLLVTAANWGILRHLLLGPNWRCWWFGCFCAGLGIITKGVGFLPLLLLLPYLLGRRLGFEPLPPMGAHSLWRWWAGLLALAAAVSLWLLPMLWTAHRHSADPVYPAYVHDILFHQTADRYAHSWIHRQPVWYFLPVILLNWLPLSLTYPGTVPRWWQALRQRDARILLPLGWILLLLVFFSIPAGKRDVYIMPAVPMLALISGPYLETVLASRWMQRACSVFVAALALLLVGGGLYAWLGHPRAIENLSVERGFDESTRYLWWLVIGLGAGIGLIGWLARRRPELGLLAAYGLIWIGWGLGAYPLLNSSSSAAGLMADVRSHLGPDDALGLVAWKEQNLLMLQRPATDFGFSAPETEQFARGVAWLAADPQHRWLFALDEAVQPCLDTRRAIALGHANRRDWWLFRIDAVKPGCVATM